MIKIYFKIDQLESREEFPIHLNSTMADGAEASQRSQNFDALKFELSFILIWIIFIKNTHLKYLQQKLWLQEVLLA